MPRVWWLLLRLIAYIKPSKEVLFVFFSLAALATLEVNKDNASRYSQLLEPSPRPFYAPDSKSRRILHQRFRPLPTMSKGPISQAFKPGTLYALLLYRGDHTSWHCALFLPQAVPNSTDEIQGRVWHCSNMNKSSHWTYEELSPDALHISERLVLAAVLADLSGLGEFHEVAAELSNLLREVPVRPEAHKSVFNCRTWMLDGIGELDDGGFLSCVNTVALELELVTAAMIATPKFKEDGSYVIIHPMHCNT